MSIFQRIIFALACIALLCLPALAEGTIILPTDLTKIGTEAFAGDTSVSEVIVPEGVLTIESRAFADSGLKKITLPMSLTNIFPDAFDNCDGLIVSAPKGSEAEKWCKEHGVILDVPFTYTIADSKATITGYTGEGGAVEIPEAIGSAIVTAIGDEVFSENASITSVTIPEGVTALGYRTFFSCDNLTSVALPTTLTDLGNQTFFGCGALTAIDIPAGVKVIPYSCFRECKSLADVTLPEGLTTLSGYDFYGCDALTNIDLPSTLTNIGSYAFAWCGNLESIEIPANVSSLSNYVFYYCSSLSSVTLHEGLTYIGDHALYTYSNISAIAVPSSVTNIHKSAFSAFIDIIAAPNSYAYDWAIANGRDAIIPDGYVTPASDFKLTLFSASGYYRLDKYNGDDPAVVIPEEYGGLPIKQLYQNAFLNNTSLITVTIPESITSIGESCFSGCTALTDIHLPDNVTTVSSGCFPSAAKLWCYADSATAGNLWSKANYGFTSPSAPDYKFTRFTEDDGSTCLNLGKYLGSDTSVTVPAQVDGVTITRIGSAFNGNTAVRNVVLPDSIQKMDGGSFRNCTALTGVTLPSGLKNLYQNAFNGCNALQYITIPDTVTTIGLYAFQNCSSLRSIAVPEGVKIIDDKIFDGCSALSEITLPSTLTTIREYAFQNCDDLVRVTIPKGVTTIESYAFYNCDDLLYVYLPEADGSIGNNAFSLCPNVRFYALKGSYAAQWAESHGGAILYE